MDFDFTDDQKAFQAQVARALGDLCPLLEVRRVLESGAPMSPVTWRALSDLGVLGAAIPEQWGGSGAGVYELCLAMLEIGRALAPVPVLASICLAGEALLRFGNDAQRTAWLPRLADGTAIASVTGGDSRKASRPSVQRNLITGNCSPVPDGMAADLLLVLADAEAGPTLFLVPTHSDAVRRTPLPVLDPTKPLAAVEFDRAAAEPLGMPGQGELLLSQLFDRAAVLLAFEQLGAAERALEMARRYALERCSFARPIASYQAISHKLVDIWTKIEFARAHAYRAAWALDTNAPDLPVAAAAARVAATEALLFAAQENIQVHGGIGFTWESDCQLFYRRARSLASVLGSTLRWRERLVRELEQRTVGASA